MPPKVEDYTRLEFSVTFEVYNKRLKDKFSGEEMEFLEGMFNGVRCAVLTRDNGVAFFQTLQSLNENENFLRVMGVSEQYIACELIEGTLCSYIENCSNMLYARNKNQKFEFTEQTRNLILDIAQALDYIEEKKVNHEFVITPEKVYITSCHHGYSAKLAEHRVRDANPLTYRNDWAGMKTLISKLIIDNVDEEVRDLFHKFDIHHENYISSSQALEFHPAFWTFPMRWIFIFDIAMLIRTGEMDSLRGKRISNWTEEVHGLLQCENDACKLVTCIRNLMFHKNDDETQSIFGNDDESIEAYVRAQLPLYMVEISDLFKGTAGVECPQHGFPGRIR